ncbi:MAG: aminoacyl-tRNA hydrolase [Dehalococcoidia bacterium]|nr:aminoacyl-tRNA hydrolase [Dehalococcoidia bacterium]
MTPPRLPFPRRADDAPERLDQAGGPVRPALVVGLGNPGTEYASTRHNVGTWCVRELARRHGAKFERHGRMDGTSVDLGGVALHLGRPRAYMNESGPPIAAELRRLKLPRTRLLVVYDEIDLPVGQVRIRLEGGHGGNNGMRSIIAAVGGTDFPRIRVGVDRPYDDGRPVRDPERVADWVLSRPSEAERRVLEEAVASVADAIELAALEGVELAMNRYNLR